VKVKIAKGSKLFPLGSIVQVFDVDVKHLGFTEPTREFKKGAYIDEDDEAALDELNEKEPLEPEEIVETLFLVASPKNGKFYWINSAKTVHKDYKLKKKRKKRKGKK